MTSRGRPCALCRSLCLVTLPLAAGIALLLSGPVAAAKAPELSVVSWTAQTCVADDRSVQTTSFLGGVLGLVLGPAVEAGIKGLGNAIAKAGAGSDLHAEGRLDTHLYALDTPLVVIGPVQEVTGAGSVNLPSGARAIATAGVAQAGFVRPCLVVAAGPRAGDADPRAVARELAEETHQGVVTGTSPMSQTNTPTIAPDVLAKLQTALDPERMAIVAIEFDPSLDRTAFRLKPVAIHVGQAFDGSDKKRGLAFTVSVVPPSATGEESAVATRTISFRDVAGAWSAGDGVAANYSTSWMPLPPLPDRDQETVESAAQRLADARALLASLAEGKLKTEEAVKAEADLRNLAARLEGDKAAGADFAPYTIRADVHETRPGSKFLVKLGTLLAANAATIATPVAERLDPAKRAVATETELQKIEALRITAIEQAGDLAKAQAAADAPATRIAQIRLGATCRQIAAAGYADAACLVAP